MDRSIKAEQLVRQKAREPSLVEHFLIANLHGYRTVYMTTHESAAILIAHNGAGKTTLIGALNAVLKGQYGRLQNIEFEYIEIKLFSSNVQRIWKHDIDELMKRAVSGEFISQTAKYDSKPAQLLEYLLHEYNREEARRNYYNSTTLLDTIAAGEGYSLDRALEVADRLTASLFSDFEALATTRREISASLRDIEILYLPTYRRIELALAEDDTVPRRRRKPDLKFASDSLFSGTIQFGMSDISEQLDQLNRNIVNESNEGYKRISASIINDLIGGKFPNELSSAENLPSQDELRLFFSRVSKASRFGPYDTNDIPNLDQIYESREPSASNQFLNYFLGYLNEVISSTSNIEDIVNQFVYTCNSYLGAHDPSTELSIARRYRSAKIDPKELVLDRGNLSVSVRSVLSNTDIPIESLSSGEKQMISLFAKMFLYPKQKIVLIDEPELSLSLDWQTQILPDILSAPTCRQLIAITHSPFVFENTLEPFARTIELSVERNDHSGSSAKLL